MFRLRQRRGGVLPMLIMLFSTMMVCTAMTVDIARAVSRKAQLSDACDMAAIAGATQLPQQTRAHTVAQSVLAANLASPATYNTDTTNSSIQTSAQQDVATTFARV